MTDYLRTRIAAAIYNASDDYTRKLMVRPDCPGASELEGDGKPVCYVLADAVIRELNLAKACEGGCMWQIPNHVEDMTPQQRKILAKDDETE